MTQFLVKVFATLGLTRFNLLGSSPLNLGLLLSEGIHYHLGIKVNRVRRWKMVKKNVSKYHGVVVNFKTFLSNYYHAYRYVTKEDPDYVTSQDHPLLTNSPQTQEASRKQKSLSTEELDTQTTKSKQKKREKSLHVVQIYDIVTTNNIRNEIQLFSLALSQKEEGKLTC